MADDRLSFRLDLTGEMANALRGVVAQIDASDSGMAKLRSTASDLDKSLKRVADNARPLVKLEVGNLVHSFAGFRREADGQWVFNLAEGVRSIASAARSAAGEFIGLTVHMAKAIAGAEDLDLAQKFALPGDARDTIREVAASFGNTRYDDDTIAAGLVPFARAGIRKRADLDRIATMAADIPILNAGKTDIGGAFDALGKIAIKRDFSERQLESLGLNATDLYKSLGTRIGKSTDEAKRLAGLGKIKGETLLDTVGLALAAQQGGSIGNAALEGGKTMGATLQRLQDLPDQILKQGKGTDGAKALQQALDRFVDTMNGPTGAKVMDSLAKSLELFVSAFSGIAKGFSSLADWADKSNDREVGVLGRANMRDGRQLLFTSDAADAASERAGVNWFARLLDPLTARNAGLRQLEKEFADAGGNAGAGFKRELGGSLRSVGADAAQDVIADFAGPKGIDAHSPSVAFMRLGGHAADGFALGFETRGRISASTQAILDEVASQRGGSGSVGRGITSSVTHGDTTHIWNITGSNPRDIAAEVERVLAAHYDRALFETGGEEDPA